MRRDWLVLFALCLGTGCDSDGPSVVSVTQAKSRPLPGPSASAAPAPSASAAARVVIDAPPPPPLKTVHHAIRCGECHEKMHSEWIESPHATSAENALFAAMAEPTGSAKCDQCHAPLRGRTEDARTAEEGVSCEVCHRMAETHVSRSGAKFELAVREGIKYGPRCDAVYPYFHETECLPVFDQSEFCASCHLWYYEAPGGTALPVYTVYEDWAESVYAKQGKSCQSCHMPKSAAEVATGEGERPDVPHHGMDGEAVELKGTGIKATARVTGTTEGVQLDVELQNANAGHTLPAGPPGRELILVAVTRSADGEELDRAQAVYARRLVDATGQAAPFYLATRVGTDTRLPPKEKRRESFTLKAPVQGTLRVTLERHRLAKELSARLGIPAPEPEILLTAEVRFGAPEAAGHRGSLPKIVKLAP